MNKKMTKLLVDVCNELPFVNWDRYIDCGDTVLVFGWIDRETDSYKDFVTVEIFSKGYVDYVTSSAKYSEKISEIFASRGRLPFGSHQPCQRIEDNEELSGIKNFIRIRDRQK